jgi:hypothetical protein
MAALGKQVGGRALLYLSVSHGRPPAFYGSGHSTTKRYADQSRDDGSTSARVGRDQRRHCVPRTGHLDRLGDVRRTTARPRLRELVHLRRERLRAHRHGGARVRTLEPSHELRDSTLNARRRQPLGARAFRPRRWTVNAAVAARMTLAPRLATSVARPHNDSWCRWPAGVAGWRPRPHRTSGSAVAANPHLLNRPQHNLTLG